MEKEFRVILDDYGTHGFAACQCPECKKVIVLKKEMLKGVHDGYLPEIIKCDCGYQGSRINSSALASNHFLWLAATFLMVVISIVIRIFCCCNPCHQCGFDYNHVCDVENKTRNC